MMGEHDPDQQLAPGRQIRAAVFRGLRRITEHVAPGQRDYARKPSRKELAAACLLALPLQEASVRVRTGPPDDSHSPDAALGLWAGELPLAITLTILPGRPGPSRASRWDRLACGHGYFVDH